MGIKRFYIDCEKLVPTESVNEYMNPIVTYTSVPIKGYLGSGLDNLANVANKDTIVTIFKFYCNDFDIKIGDLVKYESDTYEVVAQPRNTAHRNHHIKTKVRKVDNVKQE